MKERFPLLYEEKQQDRKKNCIDCGVMADTVKGRCRPCTRASTCKNCGADNTGSAHALLLCKRCGVHIATWCPSCNSPEAVASALCVQCFSCEYCGESPSLAHECCQGACGSTVRMCEDCLAEHPGGSILCRDCWWEGGAMCFSCGEVPAQNAKVWRSRCEECFNTVYCTLCIFLSLLRRCCRFSAEV